ncbi:hypothetical protein KC19_VG131800 [Ceratodon purpureus]|uniref:Uncharacterized protein n=1 Tax=Ceratodon purpureus TaxID=3225 RepID=A0A8T0HQQ6_CERPU|nr:hypothetical protein KC19_VG131800 [Ceratodon purpureus]
MGYLKLILIRYTNATLSNWTLRKYTIVTHSSNVCVDKLRLSSAIALEALGAASEPQLQGSVSIFFESGSLSTCFSPNAQYLRLEVYVFSNLNKGQRQILLA